LSKLNRAKWTDRQDYRDRTIKKAIDGCKGTFYEPVESRVTLSLNGHNTSGLNKLPDSEPSVLINSPGSFSSQSGRTGYQIILDWFRNEYLPTFKRGTTIFSSALGREVAISEACCGASWGLIQELATACDAPNRGGCIDTGLLPKFFYTWCKSAWKDLIGPLSEEEQADEICDPAKEKFQGHVAAALHTIVSLGQTFQDGRSEAVEVQRRSLLDWCQLWAKPGKWQRVRSYQLWIRKDSTDPGGRLQVALRVELFGQVHCTTLARLGQNAFGRLAAMYDVAAPQEDNRVSGRRVVILADAFLEDLLKQPDDL
jgi:hypothetical protein